MTAVTPAGTQRPRCERMQRIGLFLCVWFSLDSPPKGAKMILIGQYDSPFVRRVAIALHHYGLPFEHRPWSVWSDAAKIAEHNPLRRVPTLLLEDGSALLETSAILDCLDELAAAASPRSL